MWRNWLVAIVAICLSGCSVSIPSVSPSPNVFQNPSPSPEACGETWRTRVRRPERFTQVESCVTLTGVVRAVKNETDGDRHIQVLLDRPYQGYINERNQAAQHGALVMEIEPWETGSRTTSADPSHVNNHPPAAYCPASCNLQAGNVVRVTSAILTDNEPGHGWREAHSPWDIQILGHQPPPQFNVTPDPTDEAD